MKEYENLNNDAFQTAHLTKIIDKNGELIFVQISASLWKEIESKVEPLVYQELREQFKKAQKQKADAEKEEFSPFEYIETLQAEQLNNDTFIKKRFKNSTEQSQQVQQYLYALQQKLAEHKPVK
jgi:tRNA nucleotidyltransferase (CCA-adding enzyme)